MQNALDKAAAGRTTTFIAHRLVLFDLRNVFQSSLTCPQSLHNQRGKPNLCFWRKTTLGNGTHDEALYADGAYVYFVQSRKLEERSVRRRCGVGMGRSGRAEDVQRVDPDTEKMIGTLRRSTRLGGWRASTVMPTLRMSRCGSGGRSSLYSGLSTVSQS